ncbi:TRAP transporter substrate-binding protein [Halomonas sp. QX-2]|uniref:TRAP transporter substrate-binding protein n=1 Tax=Vreelandella sedimenti TaxID=2729618 RepID=A0A7Z0SNF6_9GAMM|nr:TRAP transporter substrate-binding protein [Halomonas sedimenti]NYT73745.1 TRAP transporter substrate-binding protein [Halomonas sedimenti]
MKKLISTATTSLALLFAFNAQADTIELRAATLSPPGDVWGLAGERFAEAVKERTNGEVVINMSYSGALGTAAETIEGLAFGTTNIVIQEVTQLDGYDPLAGLGTYPYLIRDYEHFNQIMHETEVGQEFHDELESRTGFKLIGSGFRGPREMAANEEINTPEDLKGMKVRVPSYQIARDTWSMLGANPVPMSSSEVYTSLQQGIIDAAENPLEAHIRSKYYEAVPYIIMTDHVNAYYTFLFDANYFDGLPEDVQQILIEEGDKAMEWGSEQIVSKIDGYIEMLTEQGAEFIYPDKEAFQEKLKPLIDEYPQDMQNWIERFQSAGQ